MLIQWSSAHKTPSCTPLQGAATWSQSHWLSILCASETGRSPTLWTGYLILNSLWNFNSAPRHIKQYAALHCRVLPHDPRATDCLFCVPQRLVDYRHCGLGIWFWIRYETLTVLPGTSSTMLHPTAGCRHLSNIKAWSQRHWLSVLYGLFLTFCFGVAHAPFGCQRWGLPHRLAQCATPGEGTSVVLRDTIRLTWWCVLCSFVTSP